MASLLDIARVPPARISLRGAEVDVFGVGIGDIASLVARFPVARKLLSGQDVDVADILALGPEIVAAIVAVGCHAKPEDVDALGLSLEEQADLLEAILKATMPSGVGPFVERLKALGLGLRLPAAPAGAPSDSQTSQS